MRHALADLTGSVRRDGSRVRRSKIADVVIEGRWCAVGNRREPGSSGQYQRSPTDLSRPLICYHSAVVLIARSYFVSVHVTPLQSPRSGRCRVAAIDWTLSHLDHSFHPLPEGALPVTAPPCFIRLAEAAPESQRARFDCESFLPVFLLKVRQSQFSVGSTFPRHATPAVDSPHSRWTH